MSPGPHRAGRSIEFSADGAGYSSYRWDFGDGASANGELVQHRFREPGEYIVTLQVTDGRGYADVQDRIVTVRGAPSADALPTIRGSSTRSRKDPEYSRTASRIVKGSRSVFCWNADDWGALTGAKSRVAAGFVEYRSPRQVHLGPEVCSKLDVLRYRKPRPDPTLSLGIALMIFTHEIMHTMGVENEAQATCYAIQMMPVTGRDLGTNYAYSYRLSQLVWRWYAPNHVARGYWSPRCRNDGPWDLFPKTDIWP